MFTFLEQNKVELELTRNFIKRVRKKIALANQKLYQKYHKFFIEYWRRVL